MRSLQTNRQCVTLLGTVVKATSTVETLRNATNDCGNEESSPKQSPYSRIKRQRTCDGFNASELVVGRTSATRSRRKPALLERLTLAASDTQASSGAPTNTSGARSNVAVALDVAFDSKRMTAVDESATKKKIKRF